MIRRNDHRRDVSRERAREVRVDQVAASTVGRARRLDEDDAPRADRTGHPGGDAVARHHPRARERVGLAQPAIRREHRDLTTGIGAEYSGDLARLRDEYAAW